LLFGVPIGVTIKDADDLSPKMLCIVTELTSRGSLFDLLKDKNRHFDLARILGFAVDAATGMVFLHRHPPYVNSPSVFRLRLVNISHA